MINEKNKPKTLQLLYVRNHPSSGGTCTAYVPMSTSNRKFSMQERKHYLVWKILPHLLGRALRRLVSSLTRTPLAVGLTIRLCLTETNGWVLLFRRGLSFEFLGCIDLRLFRWGVVKGIRVLRLRFFHRDALVFCLPFGLFAFYRLMMREMFKIFRVNIGRWVLSFRRTVIFFW